MQRIDNTNTDMWQEGPYGVCVSRSTRRGRVYRRVPVRVQQGKLLCVGEYAITPDGVGKYIGRVTAEQDSDIPRFKGLAFIVLTPSGFLGERWALPSEVSLSDHSNAAFVTLAFIS